MKVNRWVRAMLDNDKGGATGGSGDAGNGATGTGAGENAAEGEGESAPSEEEPQGLSFAAALGLSTEQAKTLKPAPAKETLKPKAGEGEAGTAGKGKEGEGAGEIAKDDELKEAGVPADQAELPHVKKMLGRINKVVSQRNTLRGELDTVRAELTELKANPPKGSGGGSAAPAPGVNPLFTDVADVAGLDTLTTQAEGMLSWADQAEAHWETAGNTQPIKVSDGQGGTTEITPAQVKEHRRKAEAILRQAPKERQRLALTADLETKAVEEYPFLKDDDDPRTAMTKVALDKVPGLRALPEGKMLAAIIGQELHTRNEKRKAAEAAGKGKVTTPPAKKETELAPPPPLGAGGAGGGAAASAGARTTQTDGKTALADLPRNSGQEGLASFFKKTSKPGA